MREPEASHFLGINFAVSQKNETLSNSLKWATFWWWPGVELNH